MSELRRATCSAAVAAAAPIPPFVCSNVGGGKRICLFEVPTYARYLVSARALHPLEEKERVKERKEEQGDVCKQTKKPKVQFR